MAHDTNDAARMAALLDAIRASEAKAYNALLRTYDQQQAVAARTDPTGLLASGGSESEALWAMTLCCRAEFHADDADTHASDAFWLAVDVEALDRNLSAGSEAVSPHDIDRSCELVKDAQAYARAARRIAEDMRHWADVRVGALASMCGSTGADLWAKYEARLPLAA